MSQPPKIGEKKFILTSESIYEIKRLKLKTRNKVRAIATVDDKAAVKILNSLRKQSTVSEILQIERAIRSFKLNKPLLPDYFPDSPQVDEVYHRLCCVSLEKQLDILDSITGIMCVKLEDLIQHAYKLNLAVLENRLDVIDDSLRVIVDVFGYSHFVLRKVVLARTINDVGNSFENIDGILEKSGIRDSKLILSSIMHCFQDEQDFLSMKKAILGIADKGDDNKYTRDIARLAFHPIAKDGDDLANLIQSCLQSSLIDAVIIAKVNKHIYDEKRFKNLAKIFSLIEKFSINIDHIALLYAKKEDPELIFYKQSSAWLEFDEIVDYRVLHDHFYDAGDAPYLKIDLDLVNRVKSNARCLTLGELARSTRMTNHDHLNLHDIEKRGTVTRSSLFNLIMHVSNGCVEIEEDDLFKLMGETSALARTINLNDAKNFAQLARTDLARIIIYLLIAKRSKNEVDSFGLRRILQDVVLKQHGGSLAAFVESVSKRSKAIAFYTYDVCTEDFIARLFHIIKSSNEITETRASLHKLMGEITGEKNYFDRARNLLIDHRINLVKDEIDDNRIYVDAGRFFEWIDDEIMREISALLGMMEQNNTASQADNVQLIALIERCYNEFCSNKYFGIASYLGRRIRHGTFKGHLYSGVVSIESQFSQILTDSYVASKWNKWKENYEERIDYIIREKLHVESPKKRDGFLQP